MAASVANLLSERRHYECGCEILRERVQRLVDHLRDGVERANRISWLAFRKPPICSRLSLSASCTWMVNPQHAIPLQAHLVLDKTQQANKQRIC
jgi:hypothetical protein